MRNEITSKITKEITEWFNNDKEQRMLNNEDCGGIDNEDCRKVSSSRLWLPTITMSLAENQEDPRTLAVLLASKHTRATTGHPQSKTTTKCGIFQNINQQENKFRLQDVRESSLLRRRRENRNLTVSSEKSCPFEMDSSQTFQDFALNQSPQKTSPAALFLSKIEPRDSFEMVSSFQEKHIGHAPRISPRDRFEMGSSFLSPQLTPRDGLEVGSSFREKVLDHPPPKTPNVRFEMVTSFEELVVIHSPRFRERSRSLLD